MMTKVLPLAFVVLFATAGEVKGTKIKKRRKKEKKEKRAMEKGEGEGVFVYVYVCFTLLSEGNRSDCELTE